MRFNPCSLQVYSSLSLIVCAIWHELGICVIYHKSKSIHTSTSAFCPLFNLESYNSLLYYIQQILFFDQAHRTPVTDGLYWMCNG
jgi:hypothetical protein